MIRVFTFAAFTLIAFVLVPTNFAQSVSLESFAGLAGCWERKQANGTVVNEIWMKPAGTSIIGAGRTVRNGKTSDFEFLRIEQREDGLYYVAKPRANAAETSFKLKTPAEGTFVFENLAHDFPQRIIYKINGNSLAARIEGTMNGQNRGIDFPMTRIACN